MDREQYVSQASERFQEAWRGIEPEVLAVFPAAEPTVEWDLPGWTVPLPNGPVGEAVGTLPNDRLYVLLADRQAGPTLHFWNPASYTFLDDHADWLRAAGFKPMRGCLQFTRKQPYPVEAVRRLLAEAKTSWP